MDLRQYFKERRSELFPGINDWTAEHQERRTKNPNNMEWSEWFWFHKTAYSFFKIGIPITGAVNMLLFGMIGYYFDIKSVMVITGIMGLICCYSLLKAIKEVKLNPSMTFYDLWLRDYGVKLE